MTTIKPSLISFTHGVSFYECPVEGDETSLLIKGTDGNFYYTDLYDLPCSREEALSEYEAANCQTHAKWEAGNA